jgi:pimeloyl-ACP methyl ester carboxylesterase
VRSLPPDEKVLVTYRRAMCIPSTAHCSIEPYRWMVRSLARPDGIQFNRRMKRPVRVPTLHLHGSLDPVGHFPHEEDPVAFSTELINWLKDPEPDR